MLFIESAHFTRAVQQALLDEEYAELQRFLIAQPDAGDLIRGGGGIRKVRWSAAGKGKSGGVRIIYYWRTPANQIYLLSLFAKNERSDLAPAQIRALAKHVKEKLR